MLLQSQICVSALFYATKANVVCIIVDKEVRTLVMIFPIFDAERAIRRFLHIC